MAEYIDKQKFIDELDDKYSLGDIGRMERDIIVDALLYAKPADVRPVVRGRWIPVANGRGGHECSECHNYAPSYQTGAEYLTKFCPDCGADMRSRYAVGAGEISCNKLQ